MVDFSTLKPEELSELNAIDSRNFGYPPVTSRSDVMARVVEPDRFVVAKDNGRIVAGAGSYPMELTVPGGATLPTSGVTWVSVSATHTRRGLTRTMMAWLRSEARRRDEPLLALTASEGGIYERFGYGVSTWHRLVSIDRRQNRLRPFTETPEAGPENAVRLIDPFDHLDDILGIYDRYRRQQVGEMSRTSDMFTWCYKPKDGELLVGALHNDGFAMWSIKPDWDDGYPRHGLDLIDFFAVTEQATHALWRTILSVDLVGEITTRSAVSPDDSLTLLLEDPRGVRTTGLRDHVWLRVEDPVACFGARSYRTSDSFVVGVVDEPILDERFDATFKRNQFNQVLSISNDGAKPSRRRPDVAVTRACLGPLLLGSRSAAALAAGRRLSAATETFGPLDAFFGVSPIPHCRSFF